VGFRLEREKGWSNDLERTALAQATGYGVEILN
jgi:hypothetical protein